MNKTITSALLLITALSISAPAYDAKQAAKLDSFYSKMTQKACSNSKFFISAQDTLSLINKGEKVIYLDVRTEGEHSILQIPSKYGMHIPIEHLFEKANLDKLPSDIKIITVCHSGTRGILAAAGLKQLGFKNVQVLKGGLISLAEATTPKNSPTK